MFIIFFEVLAFFQIALHMSLLPLQMSIYLENMFQLPTGIGPCFWAF